MLFFITEMLRDLKLADSVPPGYSQVEPKPLYKSEDAQAYWDVPLYAEHTFIRAKRVDMRFVDHKVMRVYGCGNELSMVG